MNCVIRTLFYFGFLEAIFLIKTAQESCHLKKSKTVWVSKRRQPNIRNVFHSPQVSISIESISALSPTAIVNFVYNPIKFHQAKDKIRINKWETSILLQYHFLKVELDSNPMTSVDDFSSIMTTKCVWKKTLNLQNRWLGMQLSQITEINMY